MPELIAILVICAIAYLVIALIVIREEKEG